MAIDTVLANCARMAEDGKERTDKALNFKLSKRKCTNLIDGRYNPAISNVERLSKRVIATWPDGRTEQYPSEKEACLAIFASRGSISNTIIKGKPFAGRTWRYAE